MKSKAKMGIVVIAMGILVILIPKLIFPVCTDMIELINGKTLYMKCYWTAMAELLVGMLIIFDGILLLTFKNHETHIALNIMLFLLGIITFLIPVLIVGVCETATMPCRVGTKPALIVVGIIIMLVSIGNVFSEISSIKAEKLYKERSAIE